LKLNEDILRELIHEVLMEGEEEKKGGGEKPKAPAPPEGGGDGAIKLKIKIPDTPFEDEEDDKKIKKEAIRINPKTTAIEDEEAEEKVDEIGPAAAFAAGALLGDEEEEEEKVKEISENHLRKIIRNAIFENLKKRMDEGKLKFDSKKVMSLIKKDKFLQQAFKVLSGDEKSKIDKIFKNFIVGDKKMEKSYLKEELNELGTAVNVELGGNFVPSPKRDNRDSKNQGVFLQKFSSGEARNIIDGQLKTMAQDLRKVQNRVIKTWMDGAKSGAIDFFDIIRGLKTGDARRAHPYETDFLIKVLTRDKIVDRFRSYFKGKKGKAERRK